MKVKVFTVLTLACALFMMACGKSDADLQKAAADKLAAEKVIGVTVAVKDGVATLTGEVADAAVKSKAETVVKGVEGIKSVTNSCTIKPPPPPPTPSPDKLIEGTVNEAIKKLNLTGANVTVTVANGEIVLTGEVAKADLTKVMQAANEAKGTNPAKVTNKLTVK
jgi:hyperosmotically inducible periplasmic protein